MNVDRVKAELAPVAPPGLHECRHTFASLMIAAGVNAKALSTYMGHASITITLDRYGHLMPGSECEAAELLDLYLRTSLVACEEKSIRTGVCRKVSSGSDRMLEVSCDAASQAS